MVKKKDKRKDNGGHLTAGRKKLLDRTLIKAPVTVYIPQKDIDDIGGIETAREISKTALTKEINKKIKK